MNCEIREGREMAVSGRQRMIGMGKAKLICGFVLLLVLCQCPSPAAAADDLDGFGILSIGCAGHLSLGAAVRSGHFGFDLGLIFTDGYYNLDFLPYEETDCTVIGVYPIDTYAGGEVIFLLEPFGWLTLYTGVGCYVQQWATVLRSNTTGTYYKDDYYYEAALSYSFGVQFNCRDCILGLGYNNLRGYNLRIGWRFQGEGAAAAPGR